MRKFDHSYGYTLPSLLEVEPPIESQDFAHFWRSCFDGIKTLHPLPEIKHTGRQIGNFELYELAFKSTNDITIKGWLLLPSKLTVNKVFVVGHGYGGCDEPTDNLPIADAAYLFLCYRGISSSAIDGVPENPKYHVLYNIQDRDSYILRGCVEDTWMAVSAAEALFPAAKEHIGFMGISFSGGIGALALPWDKRIKKAHLQVPSFGHQPLRLELPSWGSAKSVQKFYRRHPEVDTVANLSYYDAAIAAAYIDVPVHIAAALADPVVAPPGQFAIYNNLPPNKQLFVLEKGHSDYPLIQVEQANLLSELSMFFDDL